FGKLMDDSGSVQTIASFMSERLGHQRAILAVVLAGGLFTYRGVGPFFASFFLAPKGRAVFPGAQQTPPPMPAPHSPCKYPHSPCLQCQARPRFKTRSRCRSLEPRHLRHLD